MPSSPAGYPATEQSVSPPSPTTDVESGDPGTPSSGSTRSMLAQVIVVGILVHVITRVPTSGRQRDQEWALPHRLIPEPTPDQARRPRAAGSPPTFVGASTGISMRCRSREWLDGGFDRPEGIERPGDHGRRVDEGIDGVAFRGAPPSSGGNGKCPPLAGPPAERSGFGERGDGTHGPHPGGAGADPAGDARSRVAVHHPCLPSHPPERAWGSGCPVGKGLVSLAHGIPSSS